MIPLLLARWKKRATARDLRILLQIGEGRRVVRFAFRALMGAILAMTLPILFATGSLFLLGANPAPEISLYPYGPFLEMVLEAGGMAFGCLFLLQLALSILVPYLPLRVRHLDGIPSADVIRWDKPDALVDSYTRTLPTLGDTVYWKVKGSEKSVKIHSTVLGTLRELPEVFFHYLDQANRIQQVNESTRGMERILDRLATLARRPAVLGAILGVMIFMASLTVLSLTKIPPTNGEEMEAQYRRGHKEPSPPDETERVIGRYPGAGIGETLTAPIRYLGSLGEYALVLNSLSLHVPSLFFRRGMPRWTQAGERFLLVSEDDTVEWGRIVRVRPDALEVILHPGDQVRKIPLESQDGAPSLILCFLMGESYNTLTQIGILASLAGLVLSPPLGGVLLASSAALAVTPAILGQVYMLSCPPSAIQFP